MPLVKKVKKVPRETVNHPVHYQSPKGIESIDVIESFELSFHLGNAIKYILRADQKHVSPNEDLKKACWYLTRHLKNEGRILTISKEGEVTLK